MSLKYFGGVSTPGQGYVCFRCRARRSHLTAELARRNVQTESHPLHSQLEHITKDALELVPHTSTAKISSFGAFISRRNARRVKVLNALVPKATKSLGHEDHTVNSQNATDSPFLEQTFRDKRRRIALELQKRQEPTTRPLEASSTIVKAALPTSRHGTQKVKGPKKSAKRPTALKTTEFTPTSRRKRSNFTHLGNNEVVKAETGSNIPKVTKINEKPEALQNQTSPPFQADGAFRQPKGNSQSVPLHQPRSTKATEVQDFFNKLSEIGTQDRSASHKNVITETPIKKPPNAVAFMTKKAKAIANAKNASHKNVITETPIKEPPNAVAFMTKKAKDIANAKNASLRLENKSNISQYKPNLVRMVVSTTVDHLHDGVMSKVFKEVRQVTQPSTRKIEQERVRKVSLKKDAVRGVSLKKDVAGRVSFQKDIVSRSHDAVTRKTRRVSASGKVRKSSYFGKQNPSPVGNQKNPRGLKVGRTPKDVKRFTSSEVNVQTVGAEELHIAPLEIEQAPVPSLSYGLERVLFNPGVYQLQDPRSRVFNFDPYLQTIMPVAEFDFASLKAYITSSKDKTLKKIAESHGKRYMGSSSSMTSILAHFHFLLSRFRRPSIDMLSKAFPDRGNTNFTQTLRSPAAIFLKWGDGSYAIDADKQFGTATILSLLGKAMEKLLTLDTESYEQYRKSNPAQVHVAEREAPETFHYSTVGDILMRSQLDAHDHRLPGTGMFDLKTRAVVSIRMDAQNHQHGVGYEIKSLRGEWESYEREYFDMIRSAFLKYSLQVRIGRMDGIFVAFHNIQRLFGFQYISLPEMDLALHGQFDTTIGDKEFKLSLSLLNKVLDSATEKYPETSLRLHFEARETAATFMYIFAEPVTEDQVEEIQSTNEAEIREFEHNLLFPPEDEAPAQRAQEEEYIGWAEVDTGVREATHTDEQAPEDLTRSNDLPWMSSDSNGKNNEKACASEDDVQFENSEDGNNPTAVASGFLEIEDIPQPDQDTQKSDPTKVKIDSSGDSQFLDSLAQSIPAASEGKVCAWTLSIRNRVNDVYVYRPDTMTSTDKWEVDYSLTEITDSQRAWSLYHACQLRRKNLAEKSKDLDKAGFMKVLRMLSQRGAEWRKNLDEAEKGKPSIILSPSTTVKNHPHEEK